MDPLIEELSEGTMNVKEPWKLWDTVAVTSHGLGSQIAGWFPTFAALSNQTILPFFNVRSNSIGVPYNNLDQRDTMAFPMVVDSIGVTLFSNSWTLNDPTNVVPGQSAFSPEDQIGQIFAGDAPRHMGCKFRVKQDERLKSIPFLLPPGYGPSGGGFGRTDPSKSAVNVNGFAHHLSVLTQGRPVKQCRYPFPAPIGIPRKANIAFEFHLSEYVRQLFGKFTAGLVQLFSIDDGAADNFYQAAPFYGIQVSLHGYRLVQQRGRYHV